MFIFRIIVGWVGLITGLGIANYFLFIYSPSYQVMLPHHTNTAEYALARTEAIIQLMQHEHQAFVGVTLGLMLALVAVFFCGPYYSSRQTASGAV